MNLNMRSLVENAIYQACQSTMGSRHGAVLFRGHKMVSAGFNRGSHAEIEALRKSGIDRMDRRQKRKYNILVVRMARDGKLTNSRPCNDCINILRASGIYKVFYSNNLGEIACEKIDAMELLHISIGRRL